MDNPAITEAACITMIRDQQLISNYKTNPNLKAQLKKAKKAKQKQQVKLDKNRQMIQEQAQINDIKRLAIGNRQLIGVHKDVLSDFTPIPSSDAPNPAFFANIQ